MKAIRKPGASALQRYIQAFFLVVFLALTFSAGVAFLPADLFARLDPLMAAILPVLTRQWLPEVIPGLLVLVVTLLLGRVFCGYICPLGTTLDLARHALHAMIRPLRRAKTPENAPENAPDDPQKPAAFSSAKESHAAAQTNPESSPRANDPFAAESSPRAAQSAAAFPDTKAAAAQSADTQAAASLGALSDEDESFLPYDPDDDLIVTRGWLKLKYLALMVVVITALLGVNTVLWGAPLMLATRFYALLLEPALRTVSGWGLALLRPFTDSDFWAHVGFAPRFYSGVSFLLIFFGLLFALELVKPRFWCRYFCPAGALLGLCSHFAPWRRRVKKCISCGSCARNCPTAAISEDGLSTARRECITCRACVSVCPVRGVVFSSNKTGEIAPPEPIAPAAPLLDDQDIKEIRHITELPEPERPFSCTLPSRRAFIGASAIGALLGFVHFASAKRLLSRNVGPRARPASLLRPPGALPEMAFLAHCVRCGLCMKACPTNGLQPAWNIAWVEDIFTPVLIPRRGPCAPDCNACGRVCPSHAIAPLSLEQKQCAKMGTAEVLESRCIAFAENRPCVVCQEVCPFGAIDMVRVSHLEVPVPRVNPNRCFGCGYCEQHCPTARPAIVARPLSALRLEKGADYKAIATQRGLELSLESGEVDIPTGFVKH